ncbi:MAG TPA: nucleoside triphosphate pyrophosphohydrolase [Sphingomonadales bacterium]
MSYGIEDLLQIMARLRDPQQGCPWALEQNFRSIAPHTIEEAYEVDDAIASGDMEALCDELGDLLFQVVFHARMAAEAGHFTFADVVNAISAKMIRRHPHVFGDAEIHSAAAQTAAWEAIKAEERKRQDADGPSSALAGVTRGLPALTRAVKLQRRAARVGFDWQDPAPILDKIREELDELAAEVNAENADQARVREEFGDFLFAVANLARRLEVDPEEALRDANRKFERRFQAVEQRLWRQGKRAEDCSLAELDAEWDAVKALERQG